MSGSRLVCVMVGQARTFAIVAVVLLAAVAAGCFEVTDDNAQPSATASNDIYVVIVDSDSGANVLHSAFRSENRAHPSTFLPGYPADTKAIEITVLPDWDASVEASTPTLSALRGTDEMFWIPGTKFIGLHAHPLDEVPVFDPRGSKNVHGARTSSQAAGIGYSYAPEAWLVSFDHQVDRPSDPLPPGANVAPSVFEMSGRTFRWAADQPWVDVIHVALWNPQPLSPDLPSPVESYQPFAGQAADVAYAVAKGKFVAAAAGNTHPEPSEFNSWSGPPGVLAVGANDNCGWYTAAHNPDVVMDGGNTTAVDTGGFGNSTFGGTSGASSLATGYAAHLIYEARAALGHDPTQPGVLLALPQSAERPGQGPLADGQLTVLELHEVIRKTADPRSHPSRFDGGQRGCNDEQNLSADPAFVFEHMGYGEISEHTLPHALAVLLGTEAMPVRSEDQYYERVLARRTLLWSVLARNA